MEPTHIANMLSEQIGPKRHLTPEGFLLCEDVPIARTGTMVYGPGETPIKTNDSGIAFISRDADTLFHPRTMFSINGKSITNDHPRQGVDSRNWSSVTVGTVHNVRRGKAKDADTLRADLLVTDHQAIRAVQTGKVEVSLGYDADYQPTGPGEGRQVNIIGNHLALVERGRCGPRCSIGDRSYQPPSRPERKGDMPSANRTTPARRAVSSDVRQAVLDKLSSVLGADDESQDDEVDESSTHVHVHMHGTNDAEAGDDQLTNDASVDARFEKLEGLIAGLAKTVDSMAKGGAQSETSEETLDESRDEEEEETEEARKKAKKNPMTGDSAALETGYKALMADAEVLVPGFRVPVFDAKSDRSKTIDSMCAIRRKALDNVYATLPGQTMLHTLQGAHTLDTTALSCGEVATLFKSAAGAQRLMNNGSATKDAQKAPKSGEAGAQPKRPMTIAELNTLNRKTYPAPV